MSRGAIFRILDALEDGDRAYALALLLAAAETADPPAELPPRCPTCGCRAWPGDDRRHIWSAHHADQDDGIAA